MLLYCLRICECTNEITLCFFVLFSLLDTHSTTAARSQLEKLDEDVLEVQSHADGAHRALRNLRKQAKLVSLFLF